MFRNYILAALRNMRRFKVFTMINVFGLAIGLSVCMVIIMSVAYQLKSDRYNSHAPQIYRVISNKVENPGIFGSNATTALPLAESLNGHSAVAETVRIRSGFGRHWTGMIGEEHIPLAGFFADPGFIQFFEYPLVAGDPATVLSAPYSVVITAASAEKLFGSEDPLGKVIDMDELGEYTVTGVLDMARVSSHIDFEAVASMSSAVAMETGGQLDKTIDNWGNIWNGWVYLRLKDEADQHALEEFIRSEGKSHLDPEAGYELALQSILDIKPGRLMGNEIGPFMPWIVVYILSALGLIIMVSSCFNYINLSVARSMSRAREVGIRKVNGAGRKHVIYQFLIESVLMALLSLGLAAILLIYLEPAFERLNFSSIMKWNLSHDPSVWAVILLFTVVTGLIAGFFPSLVMSGFQPLQVLKGMRNLKVFSHVGIRKALIVIQFTVSLFFIISITVFYNQVKMMTEAATGFDGENVLVLPYDAETFDQVKNEILQQSWAVNVTRSSHIPATGTQHGEGLARSVSGTDKSVSYYAVDEYYLDNLTIPLIHGRMLSGSTTGQTETEVVINEKAVSYFEFNSAEEALGEILYTEDSSKLTIVGIVPDYHHDALMMGIEPLALRIIPRQYNNVQVRVTAGSLESARIGLVEIWKSHRTERLDRISTVRENIAQFYDLLFGDLLSILLVFALIATVVSCLGLLGIAIYTTELRMKEVSIRKVMGAENFSLVCILSWGFLKLVLVATVIAIPLSYLANQAWLAMMATRVVLSPWYFVAGTALLIAVALITIGSQTLRSLRVNPAESLRNE